MKNKKKLISNQGSKYLCMINYIIAQKYSCIENNNDNCDNKIKTIKKFSKLFTYHCRKISPAFRDCDC